MGILRAEWLEVTQPQGAPSPRSSHAVAVVDKKAYVFGGEHEPRVPIDNYVHVFDLESRDWSVAEAKGHAPLPRVGVTLAAVGHTIYMFAGRDEKHEELGELYSFDTRTSEWKLLSDGAGDCGAKAPPARSYHAMAADQHNKRIYIFGGCGKDGSIGECGKAGRFYDLWTYDIESGKWSALPIFPACAPRGGPGLEVAAGAVWVIFGFNGQELSDVFRYDIQTSSWEEVVAFDEDGKRPFGRSVFGSAAIGKHVLIYGGEVDPSDLGHLGAGSFTSDVLVLDTETLRWEKPAVENKRGDPGARGWFAAGSFDNSMLVYGGNSESNDRLNDMYLLSLVDD